MAPSLSNPSNLSINPFSPSPPPSLHHPCRRNRFRLSPNISAMRLSSAVAHQHQVFDKRGYACNGLGLESIVLYREMSSFGLKGDNFTYPFVLKACGDMMSVEIGMKVHCEVIIMGLEFDVYVGNSLVTMYSRFGDMGSSRMAFNRMPERDMTSWNTLISGYAKNGEAAEALMAFTLMGNFGLKADCASLLGVLSACAELAALKQAKQIHCFAIRNGVGYATNSVVNSLIDVYCDSNFIAGARKLFESIIEKDAVTWNSLISGYICNGDSLESLKLFVQMVSDGVKLDVVTFIAVLGACSEITALQFGKSVHSLIERKGFAMHTIVATALVDMYAKCGSLGCSFQVFRDMPAKNLVSLSAMIKGFGIHGKGREAIAVFNEMKLKGIKPDEVSFTSVLSACSHAGLVDEGLQIFDEMRAEYGISPGIKQYSCMVDLLGRAGRLNEAYEFIINMEIEPNFDVWAALLSACRAHHNIELAEVAAKNAFHLKPQGFGPYVMLSSMYAAEKKWEDVERVRRMVRNIGEKKPPGCSFVELDKVIYQFLVGDKSHPQSKAIYDKLEELRRRLKEIGYVPDTRSVFYNVEEDVKEKMLWDHSERLAIAFALINTAPGMCIRITKNLRVCGDCHAVIKHISKLTGREIIMRDAHRFHHFSNGLCSCGDFW
ncbi:hypothetical protein Syun_027061 [Stephania yunnanensis]|uniref:DYW domain-containing protein n=1 Tax=Stephania yunnanensis TaxID=152371 RepID=A0AAP0EH75_9MAGN